MDTWLSSLQSMPLSRSEREVIKRYELDPAGRAFLPVADILRAHRMFDDSLALLASGVARHPAFTVARVVLAREFFGRGLIERAWNILSASPISLHENVLAQKLRFKLGAVLGHELVCRKTYEHLTRYRMVDQEIKRLADTMQERGVSAMTAEIRAEFQSRGVIVEFPERELIDSDTWAPRQSIFDRDPRLGGDANSPIAYEEGAGNASIDGFHVVPLAEIFRPSEQLERNPSGGGVELDSITLAEIYAKQGHFGRALLMYRRLLKISPQNELFKRRVGELIKLEKEQKDRDLSVDPAVVDRMETLEIIDKQMALFADLLNALPSEAAGAKPSGEGGIK